MTEFLFWEMRPAMPASCWGAGNYRKFRIIEVEEGYRPDACRSGDKKIKRYWESKPVYKGKYFPWGRCAASLKWRDYQRDLFFLNNPKLTIRELQKISRSHEWEFIRKAALSAIEKRREQRARAKKAKEAVK